MAKTNDERIAEAKSIGISQGFGVGVLWTLVVILILASLFF